MVNIQEKKIKLNWAWIEKKIQRSLTKLFESQKLEPEITKVFWFLEHEHVQRKEHVFPITIATTKNYIYNLAKHY
jgi:hypothetical protein